MGWRRQAGPLASERGRVRSGGGGGRWAGLAERPGKREFELLFLFLLFFEFLILFLLFSLDFSN
jgi:hypothetical protein